MAKTLLDIVINNNVQARINKEGYACSKNNIHKIIVQKIRTISELWNLTLPGPMYNQPSHEMKRDSMPIIFFYYLSSKRPKELY